MAQCTVISNVMCYRRDYEVILFKYLLLLKPTGTDLQLNPRNKIVIEALIFHHIFEKILVFCESQ